MPSNGQPTPDRPQAPETAPWGGRAFAAIAIVAVVAGWMAVIPGVNPVSPRGVVWLALASALLTYPLVTEGGDAR